MNREADYTIKGFLYQFHLTLLKILESEEDTDVTVEGIIEDIDIHDRNFVEAIQCKYHETKVSYCLSDIYKPVLQMMSHYSENIDLNIKYKLYAYFPNEKKIVLSKTDIETIKNSKNKDYLNYISKIKEPFDTIAFLNKFSIEIGESFDNLVNRTKDKLKQCGFEQTDVDLLIYPNSINEIANISIQHNVDQRRVKKNALIDKLKSIRKTAITKWTLSLKDRKKILDARKKQLKPNLDKNSRLRYFLISKDSMENFDESVITFITDYIDKFHSKQAHNQTPVFALICDNNDFEDITIRLFKKGIKVRTGYIINQYFDINYFFEEPLVNNIKKNEIRREFSIRLFKYDSSKSVLNHKPCDDLFIISSNNFPELQTKDLIIEQISVNNFQELKYILGVSNVFE